jgi:formylmethanofuran dehydrogenase subunit B
LPAHRSITCLGCGCACDDIELVVAADRIVEARNACSLGLDWFGDGRLPARSRRSGRDVPIEEALDAAARLVGGAERPLIYLAPDISCEAQREATCLADIVRGTLDSVTSATAAGSLLAAQEYGRASATLGEIRNRADTLVFWAVDPGLRYPRFWSRYAPEPSGLYLTSGRRGRTVVAVDVGDAGGPVDADVRIVLSVEEEVDVLVALRAIVAEEGSRNRHVSNVALSPRAAAVMGDADAWTRARQLAPTLLASRYVVFVADGEEDRAAPRDRGAAAGLIALTQALNGPTRSALSTLRAGGNRSGADAVITWQTGYPAAVDFARGYPRYRPYDGTAGARLGRGEADAVLVIGSAARVPGELSSLIRRTGCAVVGPRASESALSESESVIDTGVAGIHEAGTALRMDDVPLPLGNPLNGPPATSNVVRELRERLQRR